MQNLDFIVKHEKAASILGIAIILCFNKSRPVQSLADFTSLETSGALGERKPYSQSVGLDILTAPSLLLDYEE